MHRASCLGDQYRATDFVTKGEGKLTVRFEGADGRVEEHEVYRFEGDGVALCMYNTDASIRGFARSCFNMALDKGGHSTFQQRTPFSSNTMAGSKTFLKEVYQSEFKARMDARGLVYEHRLIDDMVASALKWEGGFCGHARTTMAMCSPIRWLRASDPSA